MQFVRVEGWPKKTFAEHSPTQATLALGSGKVGRWLCLSLGREEEYCHPGHSAKPGSPQRRQPSERLQPLVFAALPKTLQPRFEVLRETSLRPSTLRRRR